MKLLGTPQEIFPESESLFSVSTKNILVTKVGPKPLNTFF